MDKIITITFTEDQARVVSWACEHINRLQLMQFDVLTEICHRKGQPWPDYQDMRDIEWRLKQIFSPELSYNAYWGIHSKEIHNSARTLFDIHQTIRQELAFRQCLIRGWAVTYDDPHHTDTTQPLPKIHRDETWAIYVDFFKRFEISIRQMISKNDWKHDGPEILQWIEKCKDFALKEHEHITTTNTPLPEQEYLDFFNQYIDENGYVKWKEIDQ